MTADLDETRLVRQNLDGIDKTEEESLPKILIVDDDAQVLKSLLRTLRREPWTLLQAASAKEALERLHEYPDTSVILSDQNMPSATGVELLEQVHDRFPHVIKIMMTGGADLAAAISAINRGHVYRYLAKPWERDELVGALNAAVQLWELRRDRDRFERRVKEQNKELESLNANLEAKVRERTSEVVGLYEQLEKSFDATISSLLSILELNSPRVVQHSKRTTIRVRRVAREMLLSPPEVRVAEHAAQLHWLGLTQVPDEFYRTYWHEMDADLGAFWEFHPILGAQAIQPIPALRRARKIISSYLAPESIADGPDRLIGHILCACSLFEHMLTVRCIQSVDLTEDILAEMLENFEQHHANLSQSVVDVLFSGVADQVSDPTRHTQRPVTALKEGMILAEDVEAFGIPVAPAGVRVDQELIDSLTEQEVDQVSVWKNDT